MNATYAQTPAAEMTISGPAASAPSDELDILKRLLPLGGARILELGCGKAEKTRAIARDGQIASILALEVDLIQHDKNLQIRDLPIVTFRLGGAEAIPAPDASFDIVLMFKSLHHVPVAQMDQAVAELKRVLKPGGLAYLSEPVYAGDFNQIVRLFHDEKLVREAAFAAVVRAVQTGTFELVQQEFFDTASHFDSFGQSEEQVLQVTHTQHHLAADLHAQIRDAFMAHMTADGAHFRSPIRVDLLRKPA